MRHESHTYTYAPTEPYRLGSPFYGHTHTHTHTHSLANTHTHTYTCTHTHAHTHTHTHTETHDFTGYRVDRATWARRYTWVTHVSYE